MSYWLISNNEDNRTYKVSPLTPDLPLRTIIERAVSDFKFNNNDNASSSSSDITRAFCLRLESGARSKWRTLDSNLTVRLANLPAGSKLKLVRVAASKDSVNPNSTSEDWNVKVALQLVADNGTALDRYILTVSANSTLLDVILECESKNGINISTQHFVPAAPSSSFLSKLQGAFTFNTGNNNANEGSEKEDILNAPYLTPTLLVNSREYRDLEGELSKIRLRDLGVSRSGGGGGLLLRCQLKKVEREGEGSCLTLSRAMEIIEAYRNGQGKKNENNNGVANVEESTPMEGVIATEQKAQENVNEGTVENKVEDKIENKDEDCVKEVDSVSKPDDSSEAEVEDENDRQIMILPAPSGPSQPIDLPDSFYELSSDELKAFIAQSSQRKKQLENKPLLTQALRDREQESLKRKHPHTLIRFRLPDNSAVQGRFSSLSDTISTLFEFTNQLFEDSSVSSGEGVVKALYFGASKKTFRADDSPQVKGMSLYDAGLTPASLLIVQMNNNNNNASISDIKLKPSYLQTPQASSSSASASPEPEEVKKARTEKKIPAWLKLPGLNNRK